VLQVVAAKQVFDLIDRATASSPSVFAQRRQTPLLYANRIGDRDDLEFVDAFSNSDTIAK